MLKKFWEQLDSGGKPDDLIGICRRRIAERDDEVRAWVTVAPQPGLAEGPLRGIPFGVKDIFETAGLPTQYGSPIYRGRMGDIDADLVRQLRTLGAIVLGKTQTTAFAYFDPAPTRNPRALDRTPGGSSSGSAAAVADGMVPFAIGTQTQGSILRPASFCGVAGFKPTFGRLSTGGILPFAPSLDTAGFFTQTAEEMQLLWTRAGFGVECQPARRIGVAVPLPPVDRAMSPALSLAVTRLGAVQVELPEDFWNLVLEAKLINDYEGARMHEARWKEHGDAIGEKLAALVQSGLQIPEERYLAALAFVDQIRQKMLPLFAECPILLSPAAKGPAPLGLSSTGDPLMNAPWTALGFPAISVPMPSDGPPLGVQLTGGLGQDDLLLATAARVERRIARAV